MDEEKIVIGAWLLGYHIEDMDLLEPSDFVFKADIVYAIKEVGIDPIKIAKKLNQSVTELFEMTNIYQPFLYEGAIKSLIDLKAKRYIAEVKGDADITEIAERLNEFAECQNMNDLPKPAKGLAMSYIDELNKRATEGHISWGMVALDNIMGGVRLKELTTVGARPSVGKSAFALQVGLSIAEQERKVLYFPLEMSKEQTVERIILRRHKIPFRSLKSGLLTREEWAKLNDAGDYIQKLEKSGNFLVFEGVNKMSTIKRLIKIHKPFMVIIDQLTQLTDSVRFNSKREQFSYMTNELKRVSMAENVAVLLLAQINRGAQETEPTMANLKESGSIEEDSDNIILLHKVPIEQVMENDRFDEVVRPMLIKIEKQRSGATGTIEAEFHGDNFIFREV